MRNLLVVCLHSANLCIGIILRRKTRDDDTNHSAELASLSFVTLLLELAGIVLGTLFADGTCQNDNVGRPHILLYGEDFLFGSFLALLRFCDRLYLDGLCWLRLCDGLSLDLLRFWFSCCRKQVGLYEELGIGLLILTHIDGLAERRCEGEEKHYGSCDRTYIIEDTTIDADNDGILVGHDGG